MRKAAAALMLCGAALAAAAPPSHPDPDREADLERRSAALAGQLRCVVCQNQTIADSQAALAVDLRQQVREQLAQGRSEQQVADYMVQRYGDFVLYRPPLKASTVLLWFGPALLLAGGMAALAARVRAQRRVPDAAPGAERAQALARAGALLDQDKGSS